MSRTSTRFARSSPRCSGSRTAEISPRKSSPATLRWWRTRPRARQPDLGASDARDDDREFRLRLASRLLRWAHALAGLIGGPLVQIKGDIAIDVDSQGLMDRMERSGDFRIEPA